MLHGHGSDKYKYGDKVVADFSSNVWYQSMATSFDTHLADSLKKLGDYPHPEAGDLKTALAQLHTQPEENLWICNGSIEGIYLLAQLFQKQASAIIFPCFSEYEDACARYGHKLSFYSNDDDISKTSFKENLVWIGNPNNPDGKTLGPQEIRSLLEKNPTSTFIIDEAYVNLCVNFDSSIALCHEFNRLIILRSFTKCFSIPGIRIGYIIASPSIIEGISQLSIPWSVNTLAIEAGKYLSHYYTDLLPKANEIKRLNKVFTSSLKTIESLEVTETKTNFLLIRLKSGDAASLKTFLIENYGILIRDASNFRGLSKQHIRVSIQSEEKMEALIDALKIYFNA